MSADIPGYIYAGAVAAGGAFGFYKAIITLCWICAFPGGWHRLWVRPGYGAYEVSLNPQNYHVQLGASTLLAGIMGFRFYKSKKVMPAGAVCVLSLAMIMRILGKAVQASGLQREL
ncbi:hypothetical protein NQ317_002816 [Molorchus minor]|uniref:Transmembrane protein 14C n=1 Tax=Molorchus minor TaxID=1323400 RepID=A0ABQ9JNJ9_9CUCU|nr:hypothetical protein NQ317_002816 [Molorchus minor]